MHSCLHQVDLLEQKRVAVPAALPSCGLEYSQLVLRDRRVSCVLQHARRQRRVRFCELLERLACSAAGCSNASFSAASRPSRSCLKNAHQQTLIEVEGGPYKPSERASCSVFFFSRSCACVNRSFAISAFTSSANASTLNNVGALAPAHASQAVWQHCSPTWKKTRLPTRGTPDGPRAPSCICVLPQVRRAHAHARTRGPHVHRQRYAHLQVRSQLPRVRP